ncbi:MAG: HAMP domain-containing sensor histidine kinase [Rhodospirillaceae bacterium]
MSHELRTPLNSIIGFSDLLVDQTFGEISPPQYRECAVDINDAGKHLLQLINDLLDLARIERGQLSLNEQRLDVGQMLNACVKLARERAIGSGVQVRLNCPADFPPLFGDELRIKQAVVNLLSNAVKFSDKGLEVTVSAAATDAGGICLSVTDQGIGIAQKDLAVALSEFGQVDGSLTRRHEGTGLGPSLSRKLVELHQGRLELDSQVGVGTTARLLFPKTRTLDAPSPRFRPFVSSTPA